MADRRKTSGSSGFRGDESAGVTRTELIRPAPSLSAEERSVLVALCAPILEGDAMTPPASDEDVVRATRLDQAAMSTILAQLAEKLGVPPDDRRRLAVEAIRRGAVGLKDVRP